MSFHHLRNRREVYERWRSDPPAHGLRRAVRNHIVALLSLRTFDGNISFADRRPRTFHHLLEVMDHRLHLARSFRLGRKDDSWIVDIDRAFWQFLRGLFENPNRLA